MRGDKRFGVFEKLLVVQSVSIFDYTAFQSYVCNRHTMVLHRRCHQTTGTRLGCNAVSDAIAVWSDAYGAAEL